MQKRTRIFAAITVSIGLLLGLGMFLATFADVGAMGFKHHGGRHVVVKKNTKTTVIVKNGTTVTSTITTVVTSPTTITVPPSPGVCFPTPNPAKISGSTPLPPVGGVGGTAPNNAQFELLCSGLNSSLTYKIFFSTPCSFIDVRNSAAPTFTLPVLPGLTTGEFETPAIAPDNAGNLNLTILLFNCEPGTVFIHLTQLNRPGGVEFITVANVNETLSA